MSNPWKKVSSPVQNLYDIMSEESSKSRQVLVEKTEHCRSFCNDESSQEITTVNGADCDSDITIAKVLQDQFDKEFQELRRLKKLNGNAKVSVSYVNFDNAPCHLTKNFNDEDEDSEVADKKYWDSFMSNENDIASLSEQGKIMEDREMCNILDNVGSTCYNTSVIPKHRPTHVARYSLKLPNYVLQNFVEQIGYHRALTHESLNRNESQALADLYLNEPTRLILLELINEGVIDTPNNVICIKKDFVIFHASKTTSPEHPPKEYAIKVFKNTLNEFKSYKQHVEINYIIDQTEQKPCNSGCIRAEIETQNMMKLRELGVNCPEVICLKGHVLVMSFIGQNNIPAPKLKKMMLKPEKWQCIYDEIVSAMRLIYQFGYLQECVLLNVSEDNILWWEEKCWFGSLLLKPDHSRRLKFIYDGCSNISNFFKKKKVPNMRSIDELYTFITEFGQVVVDAYNKENTATKPLKLCNKLFKVLEHDQ